MLCHTFDYSYTRSSKALSRELIACSVFSCPAVRSVIFSQLDSVLTFAVETYSSYQQICFLQDAHDCCNH